MELNHINVHIDLRYKHNFKIYVKLFPLRPRLSTKFSWTGLSLKAVSGQCLTNSQLSDATLRSHGIPDVTAVTLINVINSLDYRRLQFIFSLLRGPEPA